MRQSLVIVGIAVLGFALWRVRRWSAGGACQSKTMLTGKTIIITGANTGIGKETAIDLAARNARVILANRNEETGKEAELAVRKSSGSDNVHFRKLDLSSFASIRKFAETVLAEEARLDILVNNAGVMLTPYSKTNDGFEVQFGVNHLGHFLLTNLLLEKIKEAPEGRIIMVSSRGHRHATDLNLDLDVINHDYTNDSMSQVIGIYGKSKLANILFANALAKRLADTTVTVNSVHPGTVRTELLRYHSFGSFLSGTIGHLMFKTPWEGAQTTICCAASEELKGVSGKYFVDCAEAETSQLAQDSELAEALWTKSMEWTGLQ